MQSWEFGMSQPSSPTLLSSTACCRTYNIAHRNRRLGHILGLTYLVVIVVRYFALHLMDMVLI